MASRARWLAALTQRWAPLHPATLALSVKAANCGHPELFSSLAPIAALNNPSANARRRRLRSSSSAFPS
eukprot:3557533-Lingulodinium_polyedra.AAC.1